MTEERPLFDIITEVYFFLKYHCIVKSQYDFSRNVLKRSAGYYAYLKSSGAEADTEAVFFAFFTVKKLSRVWGGFRYNPSFNSVTHSVYKDLAFEADGLIEVINSELSVRFDE